MLLNCRLFRVPWTARGSNQSTLKEINPEYSLQGLMLKLKLQHFGHLRRRADSLEKTLMLGKTEGRGNNTRWNSWTASRTQQTWVWASSTTWWQTGSLACLKPWGPKESDTTERLNNRRVLCIFGGEEANITYWRSRNKGGSRMRKSKTSECAEHARESFLRLELSVLSKSVQKT